MKNRSTKVAAAIIAIIVTGVAVYVIDQHIGSSTTPLTVYSADAYVMESSSLLSSYHNLSGVPVAPVKGAGSLTAARQIGQGAPSDVFISVSLESYGKSYLQSRYSGWAVAFASDQMVIAYSKATLSNSSASHIINQFSSASNTNSTADYNRAFTNLTSGSVKVGISNPNNDPAGFRGWLSLEIAGSTYHGNRSYYMDSLSKNGGNISASDASQLVAPLENGNIQFLFLYKSAAMVKGLDYISLPAEVNLGSVNYAGYYSKFSYNLSTGSVTGAPIYLYISALANSSNAASALGFAEYVLNNTASLKGYGLTPIAPEMLFSNSTTPPGITAMVNSGNITKEGSL